MNAASKEKRAVSKLMGDFSPMFTTDSNITVLYNKRYLIFCIWTLCPGSSWTTVEESQEINWSDVDFHTGGYTTALSLHS